MLRTETFTWLPLVTRFGAWLVIYVDGEREQYFNLDPFSGGGVSSNTGACFCGLF